MLRLSTLLAVAALAVAQDTSSFDDSASITSSAGASSSTNPSSTSSGPVTHTVGVAQGGHTYVPDVTLAEVGDVIEFDFYPTNHSVIRAEYEYPCIPYENTGVNKFGFSSGFKPVDAILPDPPKFFLTVNDTDPIFYYCGAPGSCINYQMVGVINPNASTSLVTQKQLAKDSTFMLLPGEPWPSEEDGNPLTTSASSGAGSSPTASQTSAGAAATTSEAAAPHANAGLSSGAIAGIAIGAAAVALGAAIALFLCGRQSRNRRQSQMMHHNPNIPFYPASVAGSHHPGHMSYASQPSMNKHMSMHSNLYSSALPGYAPIHHPGHDSTMSSPPLHPSYAQSDALNPGPGNMTEATSPAHSPGVAAAVPAYSQRRTSMTSNSTHPSTIFGAPAPGPNVHEMAAPFPSTTGVHQVQHPHQHQPTHMHTHMQNPRSPTMSEPHGGGAGGGIMGFIRKSSISKGAGVERYS